MAYDIKVDKGKNSEVVRYMGERDGHRHRRSAVSRRHLTKLCEDLRSEKTRLTSEILELQNQNAQLIEDHTRDVLSIKAKETQLVRARSDAEAAEQTTLKQQREVERLKRELSRALRASAVSPPNPYAYDSSMPGEGDNLGGGGGGGGGGGVHGMHSQSSSASSRMDARRSYLGGLAGIEDKENRSEYGGNADQLSIGHGSNSNGGGSNNSSRTDLHSRYEQHHQQYQLHGSAASASMMPPPSPGLSSRKRFTPPSLDALGGGAGLGIGTGAPGGGQSPMRRSMSTRYSMDRHAYSPSGLRGDGAGAVAGGLMDRQSRRQSSVLMRSSSLSGNGPGVAGGSGSGSGGSSGGDGENWKRAAEVTSQLKARIEQMKARQGLTSRSHR
ncbi:Cytoskeleton associated protein 5 [Ascosphaera acerosa]|nr:Cytoskeleton associated protein 5 [Ascosphaera acerosa]